MLGFTREELDTYTRPLASPARYAAQVQNWETANRAFLDRAECCPGGPVHLHVEATADCNLHCPICPRGRDLIERSGHLSFDSFARAFDLLSPGLANIVISGWGEPLLNPDTPRMIERATSQGVSVFMNTNGTVMEDQIGPVLDSGLTVICISLDGAESRPTHVYDDEFTFERVVTAVQHLRAAKDRGGYQYPQIHGKFIVAEDTAGEMEELTRWAHSIGVEHVKFKRRIRTMPSVVPRSQFVTVAELLKITESGKVRSTEDLSFTAVGCSHPWSSLFLDARGRLGLCSWDPHQLITIGEPEGDLDQVWNSEPMRQVRRWHSSRETPRDPCRTCNRLPGYLVPTAGEEALATGD